MLSLRNLSLILCSLMSGCASVTINSKPAGAEVILAVPGQENGKSLGKTPLNKSLSEITSFANKSTIVVTLKRPGYLTQSFVIPNLGGGRLEIDTTLKAVGSDDATELNRAVRFLLDAEQLIIEKKFNEALKELEKSKSANPNIAAAYTFEGTIFFLQNQMEKAREAFLKAIALDPEDPQLKALLAKTEGGGEQPANRPRGRGRK